MNLERLEQQIQFILEIDKLKGVLRRTYLLHEDRNENTAEHSWHLAIMAIVLAEHANQPVDLAQVIKMVLIHDIVEIDAGDTFAYDEVGYQDKAEREARAADRLFGLLPSEQAQEFRQLWDEFEERSSMEAKFANALDRMMPMLHNYHTAGRNWQKHGIRKSQVVNRNQPMEEGSTIFWHYIQEVIEDAVSHGFLADE